MRALVAYGDVLLTEVAHARRPLGKSMANVECNAVSAVQITHVFVTRMLAKKQRGCVVFTSSAAACQPCPFSSMYGATKAFISSFGASLAIEVKTRGIDVTVVHPSPVASRFYDKAHALDSIAFFKKCVRRAASGLCTADSVRCRFNVEPDALPDLIFAAVGRCVWRDIGGVAVAFRLMMKLIVRFPRLGCVHAWTEHLRHSGFQPYVHADSLLRAADGGLQEEFVSFVVTIIGH